MNCIVKRHDQVIFTHDGKWLHPLFAVEDFLAAGDWQADQLFLEDKIIGRGAAVLIARMGFTACHGRIVSRKALPLLERYSITVSWDQLVDTLQCQTEQILTDGMSLDEAYRELCRRAGRSGS